MIYEVTIAEKAYRVELVRTREEWKCKLDGRELPAGRGLSPGWRAFALAGRPVL